MRGTTRDLLKAGIAIAGMLLLLLLLLLLAWAPVSAAGAQEILSFLDAYTVTHDETLLDKAQELLAPLRAHPNSLGLWDSHHLGYHAALTFPGKTIAHPGTPALPKHTKQGGQQLLMLEAFQVANTLTNGQYSSMVTAMEQVAVNKAYYAAGHGYLDQETADWKPLVLQSGDNAGDAEDWVTTEAMGIALQVLQSLPIGNFDEE